MATSFRELFVVSGLVLAGGMLVGWSLSERPASDIFNRDISVDVEFWPTMAYVFSRNLLVVGILVAGSATCGVVTLTTLAWNGYRLGFGFSTLYMASTERAMWVLAYLPLEFGALLLASTAALELSRQAFLSLLCGQEFRMMASSKALAGAVCMLAVAAAIEGTAALAIARL